MDIAAPVVKPLITIKWKRQENGEGQGLIEDWNGSGNAFCKKGLMNRVGKEGK